MTLLRVATPPHGGRSQRLPSAPRNNTAPAKPRPPSQQVTLPSRHRRLLHSQAGVSRTPGFPPPHVEEREGGTNGAATPP